MNRTEALDLVKQHIEKVYLINHMLSVEACMKKIAFERNEDAEDWALAGLLHDIDYEMTKDTPEKHGLLGAEILRKLGIKESILSAVESHSSHSSHERVTLMAKALYAIDPLSGLIIAATLMTPEKKLSSVTTPFVLKRFKEKRFAAGANREQIKTCEEWGLSLEKLIELSITAMQEIAPQIGL